MRRGRSAIEGEKFVRLEGTERLRKEAAMPLDLAISRCRTSGHADEEVKELVRGALEATKQEIAHLEELVDKSERGSGPSQKARLQSIGEKGETQERGLA
jgi:hypothetical protein